VFRSAVETLSAFTADGEGGGEEQPGSPMKLEASRRFFCVFSVLSLFPRLSSEWRDVASGHPA